MSTRGNIGIIYRGGSVRAIYSHWDSYPEHNGAILLQYYSDEQRVISLLDNGNVSILAKHISPQNYNDKHTFNNPQEDVCVFYGRDRGENGQDATFYKNLTAFQATFKEGWGEFYYLWDCVNRCWLYGNSSYADKTYVLTRKRCGLPALDDTNPVPPVVMTDDNTNHIAQLAAEVQMLRSEVDVRLNRIGKLLLNIK